MKYPEWIYRQSAALPYRRLGDDLDVLLVTSRKGKRWLFPKGIVEPGMTPFASAAKEAGEEAGVEGEIWTHSLGSYAYRKWGDACTVDVFPMQVTLEREDWPEAGFRQRAWMPVSDAVDRIDQSGLGDIVHRLPKALETITSEDRQPSAALIGRPRLIYLLRHAKSSRQDPALEDMARPLAPRGLGDCEVMRDYMRFADVHPDVVLCSPAVRTRQTLAAVSPVLGEGVDVTYDHGLYTGDEADLAGLLRRVPNEAATVLIIGHNPALHALAVGLADGGDAAAVRRLETGFPAAGLATLIPNCGHWQDLKAKSCKLHSFILPRDLV